MKNHASVGVGSFANAVPVAGGFVVHHSKKLAPSNNFVMFAQKPPVSHDVCLHNGMPLGGKETAHYSMHFTEDQARICLELCMNGCR